MKLGLTPPLAIAWALSLAACRVTNPDGYDTLREAAPEERVTATPGVMYGFAPRSWDLVDGRQISVELDRARVSSGMGLYAADIAFDVQLEGSAAVPPLRCETRPSGPRVPETRFGCWSEDESVEYWVGAGRECHDRNVNAARTLGRPECWEGTLRVGDVTYHVDFGHAGRGEWVIDRVTWTDANSAVVQAADLVAEMRVELYRDEALPEDQRDALALHAMALHQWVHVQSPS